jgi:hypothetical protein
MRLSIWLARSRQTLIRGAVVLVASLLIVVAVQFAPKLRAFVGWGHSSEPPVVRGEVMLQVWNELLHRYVDAGGNVDYARWRDSPDDVKRLDDYLASFSHQDPHQLTNKSQQLAIWINAYNAVTIRQILSKYATNKVQNPVSHDSGKNAEGDLRLTISGADYSLDEIEHSILRQFSEPRVHFALNCGSRGCPRLLDEAYDAERLEDQLEQNAREFFADKSKFSVDEQRGEVKLSPILNWYASDFGGATPDVLRRIAPWLPDEARSINESKNMRVIYSDYDWTLNDQTQGTEPPLPPPDSLPPPLDQK